MSATLGSDRDVAPLTTKGRRRPKTVVQSQGTIIASNWFAAWHKAARGHRGESQAASSYAAGHMPNMGGDSGEPLLCESTSHHYSGISIFPRRHLYWHSFCHIRICVPFCCLAQYSLHLIVDSAGKKKRRRIGGPDGGGGEGKWDVNAAAHREVFQIVCF